MVVGGGEMGVFKRSYAEGITCKLGCESGMVLRRMLRLWVD